MVGDSAIKVQFFVSFNVSKNAKHLLQFKIGILKSMAFSPFGQPK